MLYETTLPSELVSGEEVRKLTLESIDEIQHLEISPYTRIKMHGHQEQQWELWVILKERTAYICMPSEKHEFVNLSRMSIDVLAIKGKGEYTYGDFSKFVSSFGWEIKRGSVLIDDEN